MNAPACPVCWKAEATRSERLIAAVASWLAPRPSPIQQIFTAQVGMMRAALGVTEPTWYERHRQAWEDTGDVLELERMTRHVPTA